MTEEYPEEYYQQRIKKLEDEIAEIEANPIVWKNDNIVVNIGIGDINADWIDKKKDQQAHDEMPDRNTLND